MRAALWIVLFLGFISLTQGVVSVEDLGEDTGKTARGESTEEDVGTAGEVRSGGEGTRSPGREVGGEKTEGPGREAGGEDGPTVCSAKLVDCQLSQESLISSLDSFVENLETNILQIQNAYSTIREQQKQLKDKIKNKVDVRKDLAATLVQAYTTGFVKGCPETGESAMDVADKWLTPKISKNPATKPHALISGHKYNIPDVSLTSSLTSSHNMTGLTSPECSRIGIMKDKCSLAGWVYNNKGTPWIQADFGGRCEISRVVVMPIHCTKKDKSCRDLHKFQNFRLAFNKDGHFRFVMANKGHTPRRFPGLTNIHLTREATLTPPVVTDKLRLLPGFCKSKKCGLNWEVFGTCSETRDN